MIKMLLNQIQNTIQNSCDQAQDYNRHQHPVQFEYMRWHSDTMNMKKEGI